MPSCSEHLQNTLSEFAVKVGYNRDQKTCPKIWKDQSYRGSKGSGGSWMNKNPPGIYRKCTWQSTFWQRGLQQFPVIAPYLFYRWAHLLLNDNALGMACFWWWMLDGVGWYSWWLYHMPHFFGKKCKRPTYLRILQDTFTPLINNVIA